MPFVSRTTDSGAVPADRILRRGLPEHSPGGQDTAAAAGARDAPPGAPQPQGTQQGLQQPPGGPARLQRAPGAGVSLVNPVNELDRYRRPHQEHHSPKALSRGFSSRLEALHASSEHLVQVCPWPALSSCMFPCWIAAQQHAPPQSPQPHGPVAWIQQPPGGPACLQRAPRAGVAWSSCKSQRVPAACLADQLPFSCNAPCSTAPCCARVLHNGKLVHSATGGIGSAARCLTLLLCAGRLWLHVLKRQLLTLHVAPLAARGLHLWARLSCWSEGSSCLLVLRSQGQRVCSVCQVAAAACSTVE